MNFKLYEAIISSDLNEVNAILNDTNLKLNLNEVFEREVLIGGDVDFENPNVDFPNGLVIFYDATFLDMAMGMIKFLDKDSVWLENEEKIKTLESIENQIEIIKRLVTKGAIHSINYSEGASLATLPLAVYEGKLFTASHLMMLTEYLLQFNNSGIKINHQAYGANGLKYLMQTDSSKDLISYFKLLFRHGFDVNADYGTGLPPLALALALGCPKLIKLMLDEGADVFAKVDLTEFSRVSSFSREGILPLAKANIKLFDFHAQLILDAEIKLKNQGVTVAATLRFAQIDYYRDLHKGLALLSVDDIDLGIPDTLKLAFSNRMPEYRENLEDACIDIAVSYHLESEGLIPECVNIIQAYRSHTQPGLITVLEMKKGLYFQTLGLLQDMNFDKNQIIEARKLQRNALRKEVSDNVLRVTQLLSRSKLAKKSGCTLSHQEDLEYAGFKRGFLNGL